jgi:putative hydrolase of the HAD superfamily
VSAAGAPATVRCVIFDIDDTLYLERDYVRSGFDAIGEWARAELGLEGVARAAWARFVDGRRGDVFDAVLRDMGLDPSPATIGAMVTCYRTHRPRITTLPDAARLVTQLHGQVPLAAVTDGPLASQRAKADALGIARWSELVVFTEEFGPGFAKPHPRAFEMVESYTGTRSAENVYLADNPQKDFAAPRALGWRTVRVRRAGSLHADMPSGDDVDVEVLNLSDVARQLGFGADRPVRP